MELRVQIVKQTLSKSNEKRPLTPKNWKYQVAHFSLHCLIYSFITFIGEY